MKKSILSVGLSICVSAASWGAIITDDFNRADQAFTNDTSLIGADWAQDSTDDEWAISGGELHANSTAPAVMYNTGLETFSGNGTNLTYSLVTTCLQSNRWAGVVFNYQDENNYYFFRLKTGSADFHILKRVGGVNILMSAGTASETFDKNVPYTITIVSKVAYDFWPNVRRGDTIIVQGHANDGDHNFTGGYAGMFVEANGLSIIYDDFSLEVSPPPTEVYDDFNRANTPSSPNTTLLGGYWTQSSGSGNAWSVTNNSLHALPNANPAVLYNTAFETISGDGTNFSVSADIAAETDGTWAGVVFNYQDDGNFYYLRINTGSASYQLISYVAGANETIMVTKSDAGVTFVSGTLYTLTVTSDTAHTFDFTITEIGSSTVLNPTTTATDPNARFSGGYAGLYSPSAGRVSIFDNFSLQGPLAETGYVTWAAGWGVDIGAETNDYDLDGLVNIYEYGLGGDPTNAANQGTFPEFGIVNVGGTNWFGYLHPQLSDPDSGLSYFLELSTDLVNGSWTNSGYTIAGTNVTGGELDFVTNVTDTVNSQKFIKLIIE